MAIEGQFVKPSGLWHYLMMRNVPKNCRHCAKSIPGAESMPPNQYDKRQFCGRKCSMDAARLARKGKIGQYSNKNWNQ